MPEFKLFTLEEAERTLPLVRRIVQDLTVEYPAWRAAVGAVRDPDRRRPGGLGRDAGAGRGARAS